MNRLNLARPRIRRVGLYLRRPTGDRAHAASPRVQLYRPVPGLGRVPAPMLHRSGYQATPQRLAPLCSPDGGPYGRVVWIRLDQPPPLRLCPACENLVAGRSHYAGRRR